MDWSWVQLVWSSVHSFLPSLVVPVLTGLFALAGTALGHRLQEQTERKNYERQRRDARRERIAALCENLLMGAAWVHWTTITGPEGHEPEELELVKKRLWEQLDSYHKAAARLSLEPGAESVIAALNKFTSSVKHYYSLRDQEVEKELAEAARNAVTTTATQFEHCIRDFLRSQDTVT